MFDALVASLDWGSGFMDAETIESVLIVAELAGFDVGPHSIEVDVPGLELPPPPQFPAGIAMPFGGWPSDRPELQTEANRKRAEWRDAEAVAFQERQRVRAEAIVAWRAQVQTKARAMATEES